MNSASPATRLAGASIRIDSMPVTGRDLILTPGDGERAALATQLAITSVRTLTVHLNAVRFRGGIRVTGRLTAGIEQPSVVSLEPVTQAISEPIDRIFLPAGAKDFAADAGAEIFVDMEGDDVPDHFQGTEVDLSELIVETLALAIDPYPRVTGETVNVAVAEADQADESPFAVLHRLRDGTT